MSGFKKNPVVLSLRVGKIKTTGIDKHKDPFKRKFTTGFQKLDTNDEIFLTKTGLKGDEVSDKKNHGGFDKALLMYSEKNYERWKTEKRSKNVKALHEYGALGENITISELDESCVCIGDVFDLGKARIQVSQSRQPCWKISRYHNVKDLTLWIEESGRTGWYFRVLQEGNIKKGDTLKFIKRVKENEKLTVKYVGDILRSKKIEVEKYKELINCKELTEDIRIGLKARLEKGLKIYDPTRRLYGDLIEYE